MAPGSLGRRSHLYIDTPPLDTTLLCPSYPGCIVAEKQLALGLDSETQALRIRGAVMRRCHAGLCAVLVVVVSAVTLAVPAAATLVNSGILLTARLTFTATSTAPSSLFRLVEYDPSNTSYVQGDATPSAVDLFMIGGTRGINAGVNFAAPTGTNFRDGFYYGDDPYGKRGFGSLDDGLGCEYASFVVADVAYSGNTLTRLDIRFQTTCAFSSNVNAVLFGELQLGEPEPSAGLTANVRTASWPDVPVGTRSTAIWPVWVRNTASSAVALGALTKTGANAADFPVASDQCSNHSLAAHTACQIDLAFTPSAANLRTATFALPAGSSTVRVAVSGTGTPGVTLLQMNSQPGDAIGGGLNYLITDAQEQMQVSSELPNEFQGGVQNPANFDDGWNVMIAPNGGPFTLGTHTANNSGMPGVYYLNISGQSRGCNDTSGSVTVRQAEFDADGAPSAVDIAFTQYCDGSTAALTGEIEYHASDGTPIPSSGPTVYASDTFLRNEWNGFGVADPTGQPWVATANSAALGVIPGQGTITLVPGARSSTYLSGVSHASLSVDATIVVPKLPVGGSNGDYFYLYPRRVSSHEDYGLLARIDPAGHVYVTLVKDDGGMAVNLSPAVNIGVTRANQPIHLRVDAVGTSPTIVRGRGWLASASEPSTWAVATTDNSVPLQTAGAPAVSNYLSAVTTNGPFTTAIIGLVAEVPR